MMEPQVVYDNWYEIFSTEGIFFIPKDVVGENASPEALSQFIDGKYVEHKLVSGWGARLSAPGYLDCTEWAVYETEEEAEQFLRDTYDVEVEGI